MDIFFEMTVSADLRTVEIVYKDIAYHLFYDQYMGEYYGRNADDNTRFCIGRYEYRNAPDNWNPLPNEQDFKNGFITDRLHDEASELAKKLNITALKLAPVYNAEDGKPFRYGDHYTDSIPDMWSVYYRDGKYFYIDAYKSDALRIKLELDSEEELWKRAAEELLKTK
ncbi:MAG: hypothetical protein E7478_01580 [Ruminococcaceae bacterium]|nr:hypothetical protein [Oscillospiraceae bacterium]